MKKLKIITLFAVLTAFNANAIRVYDPNTGEEKGVELLEQNGAFNDEFKELTEEQKKNLTKRDLMYYMNQVPDELRPIDKQLVKGLGTVLFFTDLESLDESLARAMTSVMEIKDVRSEFFIKPVSANSARMLIALKLGGEFEGTLKEDSGSKNARRMHVDSYPQIVYIAPDKSMARYSGTSGGVTALKMKIGEIKTILEMQEKQKQEAVEAAKQQSEAPQQEQNINTNIRF